MDSKGFFESLFDFSFTSFVTTRIIGVLYALMIAVGVLCLLVAIFPVFTMSGVSEAGKLAPFVFVLYVVIARVFCEVIIVLFKIADNTGILAGRHEQPPAPPTV